MYISILVLSESGDVNISIRFSVHNVRSPVPRIVCFNSVFDSGCANSYKMWFLGVKVVPNLGSG